MWPFSAFMQPKGMLSTKELKVGETYKQRSHRHATGFDACKTLTRKQHLTDGKYYKLTFHNGKKRRGQFYNSTDKPIMFTEQIMVLQRLLECFLLQYNL